MTSVIQNETSIKSQFELFKTRRFWPLFWVQFLGAFNDNLMKTAVVVLIAYGIWDIGDLDQGALVAASAGLFILPFVLFSALAGDLTDKFDKREMIKVIKLAEIGIVLAAIAALYIQSTWFAFFILFALGAQSAFFGPSKFSILPQHLSHHELIAANGLVSTGTYVAILMGTILGALLALNDVGLLMICAGLIICSLAGYVGAFYVPEAPPEEAGKQLTLNPFKGVAKLLSYATSQPQGVLTAMLGVSWFYFVAGGFHAQFPNFAKQTLGVDNIVLTLFMVVFSVGIGLGGMMNNTLLKGVITPKFVPWSMLGIAIFSADLCWAALWYNPVPGDENLMGIGAFVSDIQGIRILVDLFGLAFFGGLYIVPLRAMVQHRAHDGQKARIVAGNSMIDALFLLGSSVIATLLLSFGLTIWDMYLVLAGACLAAFFFFISEN